MIPFFCFDDRLLGGRHASGPRTQFLLECLRELDQGLRSRGSGLVVRHGRPEAELASLVGETGASAVHFTRDVSPFARRRGERVAKALGGSAELRGHPGLNAVDEIREVRTKQDKPYSVFSPFHRNWLGVGRREVLEAPRQLPPLPSGLAKGRLPSLGSLGLSQEVSDPPPGGEEAARAAAKAFLDGPVRDYADAHDALGRDGTSRLSPYLHFGCITPRQLEERLPRGAGARGLPAAAVLARLLPPRSRPLPPQRPLGVPGALPGDDPLEPRREAVRGLEAGPTGFPLVDAGMRQLLREGWMHNRARLVVGSFLTKDLGIDWRWGERWFMRMLVDGDEANNNGNWQWIGSVGTDPQPAFRRIFNPARQMRSHDPRGEYVRRYVPELRPVPDEHLAEPWLMPDELQREAGCVIGDDYPDPIVDHAIARREALERYRVQ